jgi:hypothetical protein
MRVVRHLSPHQLRHGFAEVRLEELAEALERAADGRQAQASPNWTTLESEVTAELLDGSGGGGNRTRVRGRTGQSVYKLRLPFNFARRPVDSRPTAGLAILWCRTSGDWLSLGAEPVYDAATRATGRARSDALPN